MQMRKSYYTTNRSLRAAQLREAAIECERAGYFGLADANWEEAAFLDPPVELEDLNG